MANAFDPYREALVVETNTVWPDELADVPPRDRFQLEHQLHADPQAAANMDYVRLHTGFCREITVSRADLTRLTPERLK
ncbi:MAG TPA: hypothetical protein VHZ24_14450 [Pirellulales bacterium]|jgi:hypothetical protein|nr:hypothetical protein [Pirellulales bacterium]